MRKSLIYEIRRLITYKGYHYLVLKFMGEGEGVTLMKIGGALDD